MPESSSFRLPPYALVLLWFGALLLLLAGLGAPVVQRTQEARVLETAREMLEARDARQWLIPELNGDVRLQKPPLAYWLAAASFKVFGVTDFAGRLPFALAGWLTLAVAYRFARRLVDARFALFTAAILLTSFMFFRHFRLAETDSLAALFVTAAVYFLWRGATRPPGAGSYVAFQSAGAAIALAVLSKGPPAAFALLFFAAWVVVERRWSAVARFLISGALLTAVVIGGWWFVYVRSSPHAGVLAQELRVVAGGEDHGRPFYMYFPQMLVATAPWTGLFLLGLAWAVADWRRAPAVRVVLVWAGAILLPLCCIGNKQNHYLVPITPALAMLAAYALHRGLGADARYASAARWTLGLTLAVSLLAPVGVYLHARHQRGFLETLDLALVALLLAGVVGAISLFRRHGLSAAAVGYAAGVAMAFAVAFGRWLPSLEGISHRTIAADLRGAFAGGPYTIYGKDPSLPLAWNLRCVTPTAPDEGALRGVLDREPRTVVIGQTKNNRQPPPIPGRLQLWREFPTGEEGMIFRIYVQDAKE